MELVTKTDDQGNTIRFKRYQGRTFNKLTVSPVADQLKHVSSFRCSPDDVLLCTFPKSGKSLITSLDAPAVTLTCVLCTPGIFHRKIKGTHWLFNMARMIQTKTIQYSGTPNILEFQDIGEMDEQKCSRMFHTHLTYPFIPEAAKEGHLKIIYLLRNPKDVACSCFKFTKMLQNPSYTGSFDGFLNAFLSEEFVGCGGSWFTHTVEWNTAMSTNPNLKILFLRFEDVKKDLYRNIVRIADFLEVDCEETFLRKVETAVSFENLKQLSTTAGESDVWTSINPDGKSPIYRKGMIGDWKNLFKVAQNENFDKVYQEKMSDVEFDLQFVYE